MNNKRETDEKRPVTQDEVQTDDNSKKREARSTHYFVREAEK